MVQETSSLRSCQWASAVSLTTVMDAYEQKKRELRFMAISRDKTRVESPGRSEPSRQVRVVDQGSVSRNLAERYGFSCKSEGSSGAVGTPERLRRNTPFEARIPPGENLLVGHHRLDSTGS
jgi:hypothetical protein